MLDLVSGSAAKDEQEEDKSGMIEVAPFLLHFLLLFYYVKAGEVYSQ